MRAFVAAMLAWAAGFVDAVAGLFAYHVYVSHMTGNTAGFASNLAQNHATEAFYHAWPLIPFLAGLLLSAITTATARRHRFHPSFAIAMGCELVLIALAIAYGEGFLSLSLLAAAMGIQTVTVTRVAGLRVYTTYLTGSLSKFAEAVVHFCFWFYDRNRARWSRRIGKVIRVAPHNKYFRHALLTAVLWAGFFAGAICGVVLKIRQGVEALWAPAIVVAFAIVVDVIQPVAAADEPRPWDDQ